MRRIGVAYQGPEFVPAASAFYADSVSARPKKKNFRARDPRAESNDH
jgi:hypothetical protein